MRWKKLGKIFVANHQYNWMATHASVPFPIQEANNVYRIYFSVRDAQGRSHAAYLRLDMDDPFTILDLSPYPVLVPGNPGDFDQDGTTLTQIVKWRSQLHAYYLGWNRCTDVPFRNYIGAATANSLEQDLTKYGAPIIDTNAIDPLSLSYPWVMPEGNSWRMWYGSNLSWHDKDVDMQFVIKHATSEDGFNWKRDGAICLSLEKGESGIARPCVLIENGRYHMWYSRRIGKKETYLMGYATSEDGLHWTRHDADVGLSASSDKGAWDGEMVCYPCVFTHNHKTYMLYNGNGFGRTGFGLAIRED